MTISRVRPGFEMDWRRLEAHLRSQSQLELPGTALSVRQFTAGRANLTYLLDFGERKMVLRRPPKGHIAPGAHDMLREFRVLSRLNTAYPRAPLALYYSDDTSIIDAPFVLVEYRDGVVLTDELPTSMAHLDDVVRRVDLALVDAMADLHVVKPSEWGLTDLGQPTGFGDRQVAGWANRWQRAAPAGYLPEMQHVGHRLADTVPQTSLVGIVHNDLKLDNCQFKPSDPDTVTSVFDWDMATLGDPLFDLGALLVSMQPHPLWTVSTEEVLDYYAKRSGIDVSRIDWYVAFATWRMAIVLKQLHNRYEANESNDERLAEFGSYIPVLAVRAESLLSR